MKILITISLTLFVGFAVFADSGTLEAIEVNTDLVGIKFEDNDESLVLTFGDKIDEPMHCIIQIDKIIDLKYKTRVMRYFGGLLVNDSYKFKYLVVVIDGKRMMYDWSRDNVSIMVNKMCAQAGRIS